MSTRAAGCGVDDVVAAAAVAAAAAAAAVCKELLVCSGVGAVELRSVRGALLSYFVPESRVENLNEPGTGVIVTWHGSFVGKSERKAEGLIYRC